MRLLKAAAGGAKELSPLASGIQEWMREKEMKACFGGEHPLVCFSLDWLHGSGDGP